MCSGGVSLPVCAQTPNPPSPCSMYCTARAVHMWFILMIISGMTGAGQYSETSIKRLISPVSAPNWRPEDGDVYKMLHVDSNSAHNGAGSDISSQLSCCHTVAAPLGLEGYSPLGATWLCDGQDLLLGGTACLRFLKHFQLAIPILGISSFYRLECSEWKTKHEEPGYNRIAHIATHCEHLRDIFLVSRVQYCLLFRRLR